MRPVTGSVMAFEVLVAHAKGLPNVERFGKSDPFVTITLQGLKKKTKVIESSLDPVWNETLIFDLEGKLPSADENVEIFVKDYERLGRNRLLGSATISLRNLLSGPTEMEMDLTLLDKNQRPTPAVLHLKITYKAQEKETASGALMAPGTQSMPSVLQPGGIPGYLPPTQTRTEASTKPEKYQIRVKVVESRQLFGSNLHPAATVKVFNQIRHTRICRGTCNPIWNEIFFFHVTVSQADILNEMIQFEVFNSKISRSKALIGSFKCDVSAVYDQPSHAFVNKWLMLSDPNDLALGVTGYLKVSIAVLGPGDECPDFTVNLQSDNEDVEGNLLWPAGIQLRPATFSLEVYHAEDLPRMDSGIVQEIKKILDIGKVHKELVDPYFIFSFAGKEVQSKILYCSDHPAWHQKLSVGFMFPSLCNSIKLIVKDWDRVSEDDVVATAYINLPVISASGENGFLPSFGPCFVNFYGSPREYTTLGYEYDADLNTGKTEGCAYRGRVLLSLRTTLGNYPSAPAAPLEDVDVWRVESYCRRRRFLLNAVFLDASMISEINMPIEFEVSIGNFGNKFENTSIPSPSSSQPTNAVFDGCRYYFLPWTEAKPAISVQCQWEDISFRLEAVNILETAVKHLEEHLHKIHSHQDAGKSKPELAALFVAMLDQLIADCRVTLPEPEPGQYKRNDLDILLADLRKCELERIVNQAMAVREQATDLVEALAEVESYLGTLRHIAVEPQNSIPDVIIWMISGHKRIAYHRIPANQLLFSNNEKACGRMCGKLQTVALRYPGNKQPDHLPVVLRMRLWLGLQAHNKHWTAQEADGEFAIYAETYENQVNVLGTWTTKGPTMTRPPFSDAAGMLSLPMDKFVAPYGWSFVGDWFLDPDPSMLFNMDAGHRVFVEDVFENQNRLPGGSWVAAFTHWTDVRGDPATPRDELKSPEGWEWDDAWKVDLHRAVDEEGWEYTVEATLGGYTPVEKTYHVCRRRRWVRKRYLIVDEKTQSKQLSKTTEGWEYASLFSLRYHARERRIDLVRRRRWHRKMIPQEEGCLPIFSFASEKAKESEDGAVMTAMSCPRMFLIFNEIHKYQLRVYIYQARSLLAGDKTGFSDPYAVVSFLSRSQMTEKVRQTLCPTWDQTLIMEDLTLYGDPTNILRQPPEAVVELFDHDTYGEPDFLGRTVLTPTVQLEPSNGVAPRLTWHQVMRRSTLAGEVLASAELFLDEGEELPFLPPKIGELFMVPSGIRPVLQRTVIEVLCWGVRNLKTFEYSSISYPSIEIECGGKVVSTKYIKDTKKNPNFDSPLIVMEMMLPKEELYLPPMNINLRDHRSFGRTPIAGTHVIKSLHHFRCTRQATLELQTSLDVPDGNNTQETAIEMETDAFTLSKAKPITGDDDVDWWAKYYASVGEHLKCLRYLEKGYYSLEVFPVELERVVRFENFNDFLTTFPFYRGKNKEAEDGEAVGELKGTLRVYPLPSDPNAPLPPKLLRDLPSSSPEEIIVRVYVVRALDLAPRDSNSLADPYIAVKLGKAKLTSRDQYRPNTLNPIFGHMFEFAATLPVQKDLKVRVYDFDLVGKDDLIGETIIDLENRRFTKHRATCGIPKQYHTSGPMQWRDARNPRQILEEVCRQRGLPKPLYQGTTKLFIGNTMHSLRQYEQDLVPNPHLGPAEDRLALHCLNTLTLVPEHVETRRLYSPMLPGLEQGKLEMWVDIFPKSQGPPGPAVNISPRIPTKYFLRVVIYNTVDVVLQEENVLGEKMSDIYVKGWVSGIDEVQKTDVHYRSLDGEGNFNWRFVFPMDYLPAEQMVVVKKKEHIWSLDEREVRLPPKVCIQIWDNDKFSFDDYLGELEMNLVNMPSPAKTSSACGVHQLRGGLLAAGQYKDWTMAPVTNINLFEKKRVFGFWPCVAQNDGQINLTGKVEMELEILSEEDAKLRPAGRARDDPNINPHLEPPARPATSFLWFTSPWKSFKFILWKKHKWYIITFLIILILVIFLLLFLYNVPEATIQRLI